jgi:2-amino-4-hydroxy-6-hydroxymethyldihydropteridine diphosphokinase
MIETFTNRKFKRNLAILRNFLQTNGETINFVESELITAYISLGSNLGDRAGNLLLAVRGLLEASFLVSRLSAIYETEPVGVENHGNYLNMIAEVQIKNITPEQMLARMIRIEYLLGRRHKFLQAPRTADLDLLLYGDKHKQTELLTLPHPRLHLRNFVLVPLAELAPHFVHPIFGSTIQELLDASPDKSKVRRWDAGLGEQTNVVGI